VDENELIRRLRYTHQGVIDCSERTADGWCTFRCETFEELQQHLRDHYPGDERRVQEVMEDYAAGTHASAKNKFMDATGMSAEECDAFIHVPTDEEADAEARMRTAYVGQEGEEDYLAGDEDWDKRQR
jgi:hypothetical protein